MKEPVITLTLEEYEELRKERERLEKEHAELQRKYESSLQEYFRQVEEISACTAVIADLRWKLADLTRRLWGKSSEKRHLPEDAGQLSICFESPSDVNDPVAEEQKTAEKSVKSENGYNRFRKSFTQKITPHARKPIDLSLPREEIFCFLVQKSLSCAKRLRIAASIFVEETRKQVKYGLLQHIL